MEIKSKTTRVYGGRTKSRGYHRNGGFGGQPTVTFTSISQERWDEIFNKSKEEKDEVDGN